MLKKKIIFLLTLTFLVASCSDSWDSVKRGVTGQKRQSMDEFLVKKKDPLALPPDFENLPTPAEQRASEEKIFIFEKTLTSSAESDSPSASSTEESILQQIKKK